jgi:hypothetical protein
LGKAQDGDLAELLKAFQAKDMKMWPISSRVNSPENDNEAILTPVESLKFDVFPGITLPLHQ